MEPVDACAVDQCRELATTNSQCGANWREAKNDLQLLPDSVDEELPTILPCVRNPGTLYLIPHNTHNVV